MDPNAQNPTTAPVPGGPKPLDPKLQEVYDKVMNFNPSAATPPQPATPPSMPQPLASTDPTASPMTMPQVNAAPGAMPPVSSPATDMSPLVTSPSPVDATVPPITSPAPAMQDAPASMPSTMPSPVTPPPTPDPTMATPPTPATPIHDTTTVVINNPGTTSDTKGAHPADATHSQEVKTEKKGNAIWPLLLVFGAIAFILLYAVIWVKIFNIKVPYLPF